MRLVNLRETKKKASPKAPRECACNCNNAALLLSRLVCFRSAAGTCTCAHITGSIKYGDICICSKTIEVYFNVLFYPCSTIDEQSKNKNRCGEIPSNIHFRGYGYGFPRLWVRISRVASTDFRKLRMWISRGHGYGFPGLRV